MKIAPINISQPISIDRPDFIRNFTNKFEQPSLNLAKNNYSGNLSRGIKLNYLV